MAGGAKMNVLLYQVGRNLNRAYRTAEAFGIERLLLLECTGRLTGNLFGAKGNVTIERLEQWPGTCGLLALETCYKMPLCLVDWHRVHTIVVGGESVRLTWATEAEQKATIPTFGHVGCLTTEAALAIALYEWRRNENL